jgi:uncharacterized protein YndB with AHSA1/START domain
MNDPWIERWNERFSREEFAYGKQPNIFLKEQLEKLEAGKILFPAEGEGRNAVFAARQGWTVSAFDVSVVGKNKALRLAEANHVWIDYQVGELQTLHFTPGEFDVIALIYAHFPANIKSPYHRMLEKFLRENGIIIFEAFSKKHVDYLARNEQVGGPKDIAMLFSIEEIKSDFPNYDIIELEEKEIDLDEGPFHNGTGSVIRFVGRKMAENTFTTSPDCEIVNTRILNASRKIVYKAWTDPNHLKNWWGPKGFTNTFNEFDLRSGGKWSFSMHGPDKGNYANECEFIKIIPNEFISWRRFSKPVFQVAVIFEEISADSTRLIFKMIFSTPEECDKLKSFAPEKNEENFDRLEDELRKMV